MNLFVAHYLSAVYAVNNLSVAVDLDFGLDPSFASEGIGDGVEAVGSPEFAVADDVGAGCTEVSGVTDSGWVSAKKLDFGTNREFLLEANCRWVLAVDHDAAISVCPARTAFALLAYESVFEFQDVAGERRLVEQVTKTAIESIGVSLVANLDRLVFDSERVSKIVAVAVAGDLWLPSVEVSLIEEFDPFFVGLGQG